MKQFAPGDPVWVVVQGSAVFEGIVVEERKIMKGNGVPAGFGWYQVDYDAAGRRSLNGFTDSAMYHRPTDAEELFAYLEDEIDLARMNQKMLQPIIDEQRARLLEVEDEVIAALEVEDELIAAAE